MIPLSCARSILTSRGPTLLTILVWVASAVCLLAIVGQSPIIGYSDNFDFIRLESCSGVWPVEERVRGISTRLYIYSGVFRPNLCIPSIDLLFPKLVVNAVHLGGTIDIRAIGLMRAVLLSIGFGMLLIYTRRPRVKILIILMFGIVACDVAYTSYFNTLYSEYAVIAGVMLMAAALCATSADDHATPGFCAGLLGGLLLVLSKEQYVYLGSITLVLLSAVMFIRFRSYARSSLLVIIAVLAPIVFLAYSGRSETELGRAMNFANKTDTYLWAVLPEATDLPTALAILGLPEHCKADVGKRWYLPEGETNRPCPEVIQVSRLRLIPLFLTQPRTLYAPLAKAVELSRPWYHSYLGRGEVGSRTFKTPLYNGASDLSLSSVMDKLPLTVYSALFWLLIGISGTSAIVTLAQFRSQNVRNNLDIKFALVIGGAVAFYSLFSSVFGDGYWELAKHAVGIGLGFIITIAAILAGALRQAFSASD